MVKKITLSLLMFLVFSFQARADNCPDDWISRTNLNRIINSKANIQTSKGSVNCSVEDFYAYMSSFVIKCENGSTIYRSNNTCEETDYDDIQKGNCIDFINVIDSNRSHLKFRDLEVEKALESGQKITKLTCESKTINLQTKFHAYQDVLEFTGVISVTYSYSPAPKPQGF